MIKISRTSTESEITVILSDTLAPDYRSKINTPSAFLNHMIEHIAYRSGIGIEVEVKLDKFELAHLVFEDVGMAVGKAFALLLEERIAKGCTGYGAKIAIIDEARSLVAISFESRAMLCFDDEADIPTETEGTLSEDLKTFLEGFAHGALCTVHADIQRGENGHHIWEATYRAFGQALGEALQINPSRAGLTAGVAGKIDYKVEK